MPLILAWIVERWTRYWSIPTCTCNQPECGGGCWFREDRADD